MKSLFAVNLYAWLNDTFRVINIKQSSEMHFQHKESKNNVISNLRQVFQIIISQMILLIRPLTNPYQGMEIITFVMQYFPSITKIEQFTLIQTGKYYLKHVPFTTIVPQMKVDHSISKNQIASYLKKVPTKVMHLNVQYHNAVDFLLHFIICKGISK